jgi:hypothetical protein
MQQLRNEVKNMFRRSVAGLLAVTYIAGCTHTATGEKAFESFDQCIVGNLGIATAGGLAIGALGKALARRVGGDTGTQDRVAAAAGVGAAVMIGLTAWKKCAAVYNRSEAIVQTASFTPPPLMSPPAQRRPGVQFERLDVRVEGTENDPPVPEFDFVYTAADPAAKDIKAVFRHKVEIVRFRTDENDQLILADASGEAMREGGRTIPLANAMRMPRERLAWVTIAEEGRDDYVEDVVIQQSARSTFRHRLQVPPRAQLPIPLPVPMRYTVTVEAEGNRATRTVDFALLSTGERPRRFAATPSAPGTAERPVAVAAPAPAPVPASAQGSSSAAGGQPKQDRFDPTHSVRRGVPVYDQANLPRKAVGRVNRGQLVQLDERVDVQTNNRPVSWAKVVTEDGKSGWLPTSELAEAK